MSFFKVKQKKEQMMVDDISEKIIFSSDLTRLAFQ